VNKTVLIIDDDESIVSLLSLILDSEGYETIAVTDSRQAVARVLATRPAVVLIDLIMPGLDGWVVARHLKAMPETAAIPLIGVTGYTRGVERARGAEHDNPFARLVVKPFDIDEVIHAIEELAPADISGNSDLGTSSSLSPMR